MEKFTDIIDTKILQKAVKVLRALNNPLRMRIIEDVNTHEGTTVSSLYRRLKIEQSVASSQLRILREAGFIISTRDRRFQNYYINHEQFEKINEILSQF